MILYQYAENLTDIYSVCLNALQLNVPKDVNHIVVNKNPFVYLNDITNLRVRSDPIRLRWLAETDGDCAVIDADTLCPEWPDLSTWSKDKPYISVTPSGYYNGSVLFSFGHREFFSALYDEYMSYQSKVPGLLQEIFKKHKDCFHAIPDGHFLEINLSSCSGNKKAVAGQHYSAVNDKGVWKLTFLRGVI